VVDERLGVRERSVRGTGRCAPDVEYQRPVLLPLMFPAASTRIISAHWLQGRIGRGTPRVDSALVGSGTSKSN
jgi:hypothetical protein